MAISRTVLARAARSTAIAAVVLTLAAGTAFAGKPGGGGGTSGGGSCYVTPNPVAVGSMYTVYGSKLGTNLSVNVKVTDSHGTTTLMNYTGTSGSITVSSYASWSGAYGVSIVSTGGHKTQLLASCSFQAN